MQKPEQILTHEKNGSIYSNYKFWKFGRPRVGQTCIRRVMDPCIAHRALDDVVVCAWQNLDQPDGVHSIIKRIVMETRGLLGHLTYVQAPRSLD
jgi:hypothetical protein